MEPLDIASVQLSGAHQQSLHSLEHLVDQLQVVVHLPDVPFTLLQDGVVYLLPHQQRLQYDLLLLLVILSGNARRGR